MQSCCVCKICSKNLIQPGECNHKFCQQGSQYHRQCIGIYLKTEINNSSRLAIICPLCDAKYQNITIKKLCPTHYDKYINKFGNNTIVCSVNKFSTYLFQVCEDDVKIHLCQQICINCGFKHDGICVKCPNCLSSNPKNDREDSIVCKCRYEYCWICRYKMTKYHNSPWNICGCPIFVQRKSWRQPLKYPLLLSFIMIIVRLLYYITLAIKKLLLLIIILIGASIYIVVCIPLAFVELKKTVNDTYDDFEKCLTVTCFPITFFYFYPKATIVNCKNYFQKLLDLKNL